jgi:hypothetical protein
MDLRKTLAKEHSKSQTLQIVDYVGVSKERFKQLINIYLAGPYRITQRAAWLLSYCVEHHPELIGPHLKTILDFVEKPETHIAVRRNTVRLLQFIQIPRRFHARVINLCFDYLMNKKEPIAVKVFSMTVLANLCQSSPDMKKELRIAIEDQLPFGSAGFVSRARKVLKEIG